MPIFEFKCKACENEFEHIVLPWKPETEKAICPECKSENVEKMLSSFAVNSESSRQASLDKARVKARAVKKEKDHAEFKEMMEHAAEHH